MGQAVATAVSLIEDEIANLRSLITELRPAALDELGLGAAIEGLVDNHAAATGMDMQVSLSSRGREGSSPSASTASSSRASTGSCRRR